MPAAALRPDPAPTPAQVPLRLVDAPESRDAILARRFAPAPLRVAEATVGLAACGLSLRGVDLEGALRDGGWALGADGRWRLPGHRGGRVLAEALGAEVVRRCRSDLDWWGVLGPRTRTAYALRALGGEVEVDAAAAPDLAAALLRLLDATRAGRPAYGRASQARRKLEAIARRDLPPSQPPAVVLATLADAPSYLAAYGTAAE